MKKIRKENWFLLFAIMIVSCNKILGLESDNTIDTSSVFSSPEKRGPYSYTEIEENQFPPYMPTVRELKIKIPTVYTSSGLPTIILEPGFFSVSTDLEDVSDRYASHGFVVVGLTNTAHFNLITTSLEPYRKALFEAIQYLVESTVDSKHILYNMIDTARIGISGHSMGGGGTLLACNDVGNDYYKYIKTAVAMNPFGKINASSSTVPVYIFSSDKDKVTNPFMPGVSSSPEDVFYSYNGLSIVEDKLFANFKNMDHNGVVDGNVILPTSGNATVFLPSMVSWFKVYLTGDDDYFPYLDTASLTFGRLDSLYISNGDVPGYLFHKR